MIRKILYKIIGALHIYPPLTFKKINGWGDIRCLNCGYVERITAFCHGDRESEIGRQCPSCGHFFCECNTSDYYGTFGEAEKDCICPQCGKLVRKKTESIFKGDDVLLFCPKCKSYHLKYKTLFVT